MGVAHMKLYVQKRLRGVFLFFEKVANAFSLASFLSTLSIRRSLY